MRTRTILAFAVSFVLATVFLAQASGEAKKTSAPKTGASGAVIVPAADLKWTDLDPAGAPGVKSADVWGDHTKGAYGGFTKFPAGFTTPLHTHTHAIKIAVVSGTFIHTPEGKPEVRLGPGSYLMQPGGNYRHATSCDKASECLFFIQSNGKFDLIPVEAKPPAKK
jgi:quercetin dioxygenase-like cupin family protein